MKLPYTLPRNRGSEKKAIVAALGCLKRLAVPNLRLFAVALGFRGGFGFTNAFIVIYAMDDQTANTNFGYFQLKMKRFSGLIIPFMV